MEINTVIGDTAYSKKNNIQYANEHKLKLVAKLNPIVTQGPRKKEDEFEFNKDTGMYICKARHMAIRKTRTRKKGTNNNQSHTYYFDINKCKICLFKDGCYKEEAESKTYSVTIKSTEHKEQQVFQESAYFKKRGKNVIELKRKIVNSSIDTGMMWHLPRVSLICKCKAQ